MPTFCLPFDWQHHLPGSDSPVSRCGQTNVIPLLNQSPVSITYVEWEATTLLSGVAEGESKRWQREKDRMGKLAVIAEKESVARDIVSVLKGFERKDDYFENSRYVVMWAIGHILELPAPEDIDPKYKRWQLDSLPILPEKFDLKPVNKMKGRVDKMAKVFRRADIEGVVNACDAGREGELIFREIVQYTGTDKPIYRLWLQSMTPESIREGFDRLLPGSKFEGLAAAAWSRSEADWLVGMNATRAVTKRLSTRRTRDVWSAGRVQTPTLALLVDHEFKILAFEPRDYWQIKGTFAASDHVYESMWFDPNWKGNPEEGEKEDRIFDRQRAESILASVQGKPAIASETRKPARESAPLPFDLTTLQREANRRFGFSARRTLQAAQRLYEGHKVLTYPRTDSKHLPEDYDQHVDQVLRSFAGLQPYGPHAERLLSTGLENQKRVFDNSKISDHFAIIPTGKVPKGLSSDDAKIFDLVMRRFLSAFYPQAIWSNVERLTQVNGEGFRVRSRTLQVPGWREVYGADENSKDKLPPLVPGQDKAEGVSVEGKEYSLEEAVTKPPSRITEGRLLGMMERAGKVIEDEELSEAMGEKGLGTPATRADTIENLISKGYVQRLRGSLKPTSKGVRLIDFLHRINSAGLTSAELTGEWEKHLNEVEHGQMIRAEFMEGISQFTKEIVAKIKDFEYDELYAKEPPVGRCPHHPDSPVVEFFWGYRCALNERTAEDKESKADTPTCDFIIWKDISGRYIDRKTAEHLLTKGKTSNIPGFVNRQGEEYEATLVLDSGQVRIVGEETSQEAKEEEILNEDFGRCPCGEDCQVVETSTRFVCKRLLEGGTAKPKDVNSCGFVLPKLVCKREISMEEASEYLQNGRTGVLEGFISKRGRPFPAILFRKDNGRHGFEFIPREKKATSKKKTTSKKTAKKTTKKTTPRKKAKTS